MNFYQEKYKELEKKYKKLFQGKPYFVNWCAKIAPKNSLTESEGICGGGETRSPVYTKYVAFEQNWPGITYFVDKFIRPEHVKLANSAINVAVFLEPRHFRPGWYQQLGRRNKAGTLFSDEFDLILTHDQAIMNEYPDKAVYCIAGAPIIESSRIGMHLNKKDKLISTCYSSKGSSVFLATDGSAGTGSNALATKGHRLRHEIAKFLESSDEIPSVDLFGSGSPAGPIDLKSDTLVDYMFSIVVENGIVDSYFTEKIMDCFLTGNIPIYRGTSKIENFFDKRGIIQFTTIEELRFILKNKINKETYKNMLPFIKNNLEITKQYLYIDDIMLFLVLEALESKKTNYKGIM